jgi:hypothetical protein
LRIFLSWSGELSHEVALALRRWLRIVLPYVEPWESSLDVEKGARWSNAIAAQLDATQFGIFCVVPRNVAEPWLNFEAGAISKTLEVSHVAPLLVHVDRSEVGDGPLAQFQSTLFEKEDVRRLIETINSEAENPLPAERLRTNFDDAWPLLEQWISAIHFSSNPMAADTPAQPSDDEVRILKLVSDRGDYELSLDAISREIRTNRTRTQHYIDRLLTAGLLDDHPGSAMDAITYGLTEHGRALLVQKELV